MSLFSWISDIFSPAANLVDELHFSGEEEAASKAKMAELKNKLAEIEAKVATRTLELQSQIIEANSKIAVAEQQHGNWLSKSHRPITSLSMVGLIIAMAFDIIPYNDLIVKIAGAFLGVYGIGRSYEKVKKSGT